jgi:MarR family transcriptional regulator for hemolysin
MPDLLNTCAHELMDTTPQIVQFIRMEMRSGRGADLSIPQFRSLRFIQRNPDTSLSHLADFLGLTLPSVSKIVDGLVKQALVFREESIIDRRRITLVLTNTGEDIVNSARALTQANLVNKLGSLDSHELETVHTAMELLHQLFVA